MRVRSGRSESHLPGGDDFPARPVPGEVSLNGHFKERSRRWSRVREGRADCRGRPRFVPWTLTTIITLG